MTRSQRCTTCKQQAGAADAGGSFFVVLYSRGLTSVIGRMIRGQRGNRDGSRQGLVVLDGTTIATGQETHTFVYSPEALRSDFYARLER